MDEPSQRIAFEPARPASQPRKAFAFLLGAAAWAGALWLGVVLLGGSYIVRHLLVVTAVSWGVFAAALSLGIALRKRVERRASR